MTGSAPPLRVRRLHDDARAPRRAHPGDAGLDLHALADGVLDPGARALVATGIAVEIPDGQAGLILPRSGLAARHGVTLVNAPGLIDSGYRGELGVLLLNTDPDHAFTWAAGDRIAQLVLVDIATVDIVEDSELTDTARADGGFGSSGI